MTTTLGQSGLSASGKRKGVPRRLKLLLQSPPKKGKTVIAHSLPRTRTLDFDDGMQSVEWAIRAGKIDRDLDDVVYHTIAKPVNDKTAKLTGLDEAMGKIDEWIEDEDVPPEEWEEHCMSKSGVEKPYPQFWDTLVIDSATFVKDAAIILGMKESNRLGLSKSWQQYKGGVLDINPMIYPDWGAASKLIWKFFQHCATLGKNLVVTAHEYHNTSDTGTLISIQMNSIGQMRDQIPAFFDEYWLVKTSGNYRNPQYEVQTAPGLHRDLGSRLGCLDPVEPADFSGIKKKVCEFYGIEEDWLWSAYHGAEGVEKAVAEAEATAGAAI